MFTAGNISPSRIGDNNQFGDQLESAVLTTGGTALTTVGTALQVIPGVGTVVGGIAMVAGVAMSIFGNSSSAKKAKSAQKKAAAIERVMGWRELGYQFLEELGIDTKKIKPQDVQGLGMNLELTDKLSTDLKRYPTTQVQKRYDDQLKKFNTFLEKTNVIPMEIFNQLVALQKAKMTGKPMLPEPKEGIVNPITYSPGVSILSPSPSDISMKAGFEGMLPILLIGGAAVFMLAGGKKGRG